MDFIEQIKRYISLGQFDATQFEAIQKEFQRRGLSEVPFDGGSIKVFANKMFAYLQENQDKLNIVVYNNWYEKVTTTNNGKEIYFTYKAGFGVGNLIEEDPYLVEFVQNQYNNPANGGVVKVKSYSEFEKPDNEMWDDLSDEELNDPTFFEEAMQNFLNYVTGTSLVNYEDFGSIFKIKED